MRRVTTVSTFAAVGLAVPLLVIFSFGVGAMVTFPDLLPLVAVPVVSAFASLLALKKFVGWVASGSAHLQLTERQVRIRAFVVILCWTVVLAPFVWLATA